MLQLFFLLVRLTRDFLINLAFGKSHRYSFIKWLLRRGHWNKKIFIKVHIFWEGHKILRNLPLTFDCICTVVKSKGKILQNFLVFTEYMNLFCDSYVKSWNSNLYCCWTIAPQVPPVLWFRHMNVISITSHWIFA